MDVCADDISKLPQSLSIVGGFQLLFLVGQLAADPGELVAQTLVDALGAGAHALVQGSAGVEIVQQRREAGEAFLGHIAFVLENGPE